MNKKVINAVAGLLATSALALVSTHASAATTVQISGGAAGSTSTVTESVDGASWTFVFGQNYGWNHTINSHDLVVSGGAADITLTAKQTATTDYLPGFTLWSRTSGSGAGCCSHQFDQVLGPTGVNAFLGSSGIDAIVGYGNAGATFTNAGGNAVGKGGVFASSHVNAASSSFTFGTDGSGLAYVTLNLVGLQNGTYLIYNGGSDYNSSSGKTTGGQTLTATVGSAPVPVPAAVWLFGSALAGLIGVSRRKAG